MRSAEEIEQLRDSFQPEIQSYLPEEEELNELSQEQLYKLLKDLRRDLVVPPWHPVTDFIKEYARNISTGKISKESAWFREFRFTKPLTKVVDIGKHDWVDVHIHIKYKDEETVAEYAVSADGSRLWSYASESLMECETSRTIGIVLHYTKYGSMMKQTSRNKLVVFALAARASGKQECDLYLELIKDAQKKKAVEAEENKQAAKEEKSVVFMEKRQQVMLTDADKELLDTMVDIVSTLYPIRTGRFREVQQKIHAALG